MEEMGFNVNFYRNFTSMFGKFFLLWNRLKKDFLATSYPLSATQNIDDTIIPINMIKMKKVIKKYQL
jgi:hypothetical protein